MAMRSSPISIFQTNTFTLFKGNIWLTGLGLADHW